MTPDPLLRSKTGCAVAARIVLVGRRKAGDEDLHDAGADFLGELLKRAGQLAKRRDLRRGALGVGGRWRQEKDRD